MTKKIDHAKFAKFLKETLDDEVELEECLDGAKFGSLEFDWGSTAYSFAKAYLDLFEQLKAEKKKK